MPDDLSKLIDDVREALFPGVGSAGFDPIRNWSDLGRLIQALESRGCFLMTNSVGDSEVRRMASFHKSTPRGYPCVGSTEWGRFPTHGEAILRAAHQAVMDPRA